MTRGARGPVDGPFINIWLISYTRQMIPYLSGSASPRAEHAGELLDAHVEAVLVVLQQIINPLEKVIQLKLC